MVILLIARPFFSFSQSLSLEIKSTDPKYSTIEKYKIVKKFKNQTEIQKELNKALHYYFKMGFLTATIDTLHVDSLQYVAYLGLGEKYMLSKLKFIIPEKDSNQLKSLGILGDYNKNKAFNYPEIQNLIEKTIQFYENNGYPFANITPDSIKIIDNTAQISFIVEKNNFISIDSIIIKGNAKISANYLKSYLGYLKGAPYSETYIKTIDAKIREIQFVTAIKPSETSFTENSATIYLYLAEKNANQFDGLVGFLPNNEVTGKLIINGELRIKLGNSFKQGEVINLNWRKFDQKSQDLNVNVVYPFLFKTPFGLDYRLLLFKQDTSYLNLTNNIGLQYHLTGLNYLKIFIENNSSNLISTTGLSQSGSLYPLTDMNSTLFGAEYFISQLDYSGNPRKGLRIKVSSAAGSKKIIENQALNPDNYSGVKLKTNQYKIATDLAFYFPVSKQTTLLIEQKGGFLKNERLYDNELFRLGGLRTLRGFDEESIRAGVFSVLNIEYRYLLETNSFIAVFLNGAYYEKNTVSGKITDTPYGFGAGLSFETKPGIFSIYYALGKQFSNPIEFRSAKIHFGFVNMF